MSQNKKTHNEKPLPEAREASKEGVSVALKEVKEKEKEAKEETKKESADLRREILQNEIQGLDKKTAEVIINLDEDKESKEQQNEFNQYLVVLNLALGTLLRYGYKKEQLEKIEFLKSIELSPALGLKGTETIAIQRTQQILQNPGKKLCEDLKKEWSKIIEKAGKVNDRAVESAKELNKPKQERDPDSWIVKTIKKHPVKCAIGVGLGVIGAYSLYSAITSEEGILDKIGLDTWQKKLSVGGLALLAIGGIIGMDKAKEIFGDMTDITMEKMNEMLKAFGLEDSWSKVAAIFGFGAVADKAKEATDKLVGGTSEEAKKAIEKGKEAYEEVDKKLQISKAVKEAGDFCKENGISAPDWLKDLSAKDIIDTLGIDPSKPETYKDLAVSGGVLSGALVLYKYTKKKGVLINAGLYVFLIQNGPESIGGKITGKLAKEFDEAKDKVLKKLEGVPEADLLIGDALRDFKLEKSSDMILNWAKNHPLESMAAINGMWIFRGAIYKGIEALAKSAGDLAIYAAKNPGKTLIGGGALAALYIGRRRFLDQFIEAVYDDPNDKDAKEMKKWLDEKLDIDREKPENFKEIQFPEYIKVALQDPLKEFTKPGLIEAYNKGAFSFVVDAGGRISLLMANASVPVLIAKLPYSAWKTVFEKYNSDQSLAVPVMIAGAQTVIFSSMAFEAGHAYKAVYESVAVSSKTKGIGKVLLSLVPGSKEWRFVFKSSLSGFPGVETILRKSYNFKLNEARKMIAEVKTLSNSPNPDYGKIKRLTKELRDYPIFEDFRSARKNLSETRIGLKLIGEAEHLNDTIKLMDADAQRALQGVGKLTESELALIHKNIQLSTETAEAQVTALKKGSGGLLKRLSLLREGKVKEAMKLPDSVEDARQSAREAEEMAKKVEARKALTVNDEIFKKPDGTFRNADEINKEMEALRKEIQGMSKDSPEKIAKTKRFLALQAYANPERVAKLRIEPGKLDKLDDAAKASSIENLSARLEATEIGLNAKFNAEFEAIIKEAKANNIPLTSPEVTTKLQKLDENLIIPFAKQKDEVMKEIFSRYKTLPAEYKTPALKMSVKSAMEGAKGTLLTRFVKGTKGRAKMMALMAVAIIATDQIINREKADRDFDQLMSDLGPEMGQVLLDVLPIVGTGSNFYSAWTGREIVTNKDVSGTWHRVSNVIWGTVGLAGDTITALSFLPSGSGSLWANSALRLAKMGPKGKKLAKFLPRIMEISERMGGVFEFGGKLVKWLNAPRSIKGLRAIQKVGIIAGGTMLVGGAAYHLRYAFVDGSDGVEIPKDLQ